ncbi:MAG: zinc ABC transporter substrate-binding protein, partial [Planktomarina sp.]|nr:zinc ABC transporter substrate-binding protein [Planktomarina sp.]
MSRKLFALSLTATLMGGAAYADTPQVAVDIAPVHSLVARVMDGIGKPDLIIQPGASPHEYSLRPSEASALQAADLVFWIGPDLTPWLTDTIGTLASDAVVTELMEADGTIELEFREGALFEAHDHGDDDDHDDHGDDDDHDDHGDDDDHDEAESGHEGHDHGAHDPHAWLSPKNAMNWLNVIAGQLSAVDPDNAGAYFANAAAGRTEIKTLIGEVTATLDPVRGGQFIVFHDAYQYFEMDFDFPASGAISISDASDPSPARIAKIQARIAEQGIDCVLAEPQFNPGLVATVLDGTDAQTGILDPLGSDLELGPAFYPQLIRNLSNVLADCM